MANKYQSLVLESLCTALNSASATIGIPKVKIDELSTQKDSISMGIEAGTSSVEVASDCTGTSMHGTLRISIVYRVMQSVEGNDDLGYCTLLDSVYHYLRKSYKSISISGAFIDNVTQPEGSVLSHVYQGGVKDYKTVVAVEYERSI